LLFLEVYRKEGGKLEQIEVGDDDLEDEDGFGKPVINKTNDELFLLLGQNVGQLKSLNFSDYNFFEHYDQILMIKLSCTNSIGVVSGHKLEGLINKQNWQREFQHNHPLVKRQGGNVEDNIEDINIEDHEVKRERQSHGHQQVDVDPWVHDKKRLVLRDRVESVCHLDGDEDRQSHGHGLWSLEDLA